MKLYEINSRKKFSFSCIYRWTNLVNGYVYIGQTSNFYVRMVAYREGHYNRKMKFAIEKYGVENFEIDVLERDISIEKLDEKEQYWMDFYKSYGKQGYNISPTAGSCRGLPAWNKGVSPTDEVKEKISAGLKRFYSFNEVWNKGVPQTEEAKEKNRISNTGEKNGMYGRKHTEIAKEKNRQKHLGKKRTKQSLEKVSTKVRCVETGEVFASMMDAARKMNCCHANIWRAATGRNKTAMGYHWEII